jgi:hypothetical protein
MMSAEDQDIFIALTKTLQKAIAQNWVLQGILDSSEVPNWRELLEEVEPVILPEVRSRLRPLSDAILGLPPLDSENTAITEWREEIQEKIHAMLDHRKSAPSE